MAAVKGLRSADNEDIVKLLGRLGTASMELAHCTDIDAVLQHARVTLEMPGGEAQLAKWHRLGHLQSVAGRFAEVMAKPSALATVQKHADFLLARAEEQAEKQAEKEKREAEEQAAKEKREAEEQAEGRARVRAETGAVAAGVFSSIPSLPEGSRRIVPVYLNMGHAAYLYESAAKHGSAWLRCASPLMMLIDRAVQRAGFKPKIDLDPDARKWDGSSWWSVPPEAGKFLQEHNLSMFLVIDEADEPYKKGGQFAEELRDFIDQKWNMSYYVSGSAAQMRDLLYRPQQLEGSGVYRWQDFKDYHGGVLRSLVADNKPTSNELPLFKMRSDISAVPARLDIARIFYDRLIRKWPGLKSESVVGMLASDSLRSVTEVRIDFAELVATINERVASSHGQQREMLAVTEVESTLSSLSDSGVLTLSGSFWAPASWTSVLAILLSAEANVELPYEQRVHLRYPTIGSTTTEPAMAGAFAKRGQQSTVFVNGAGHQPSAELKASLWKSMRALGRTDSHGLPPSSRSNGPRKGKGTLPTGSWTASWAPRPIVALTS
ncbi:hypothetical protein FNF27_08169 [Cafeteria roenbergensis]|uniref:Uncharacterized protein n=1 Tax=Cafeteria roenbergensis TaxID=33653 RepID=A0A5A8D772_CAFRO|nr:hypothetical protein FNF27_08169 [Cafeteria roenbergensis]